MKRKLLLFGLLGLLGLSLSACRSANDNAHTTATTIVAPPPTQVLTLVSRPAWIVTMISGEINEASPMLTILSPRPNQTLETSSVQVRLSWRGALETYKVRSDTADGTIVGAVMTRDHVHILLDNLPYEDHYDLSKPFELHNLTPGKHLLRVFVSRPWHESYKNDGAFQMVVFNVSGLFSDTRNENVNQTDMIDPTKPLLTYNSPRGESNGDAAHTAKLIVTDNSPGGETKGKDADPIMIDFWLSNAKLKGDGGEFRIRYFIDDDDARYIDKWGPIWLRGWISGKHTVRLELLGLNGWPVKNGSLNITTREITVTE